MTEREPDEAARMGGTGGGFGAVVGQALKAVQGRGGIAQDGVCGPAVWPAPPVH